MNTPTIVFDFGGVLLDWNPRYLYRKLFPGNEAAMERFLLEIGFNEWNHLQDASHLPFSEAIAGLCARHPQYSDLIRAYDERFLETLGGAIPGTVEILRPPAPDRLLPVWPQQLVCRKIPPGTPNLRILRLVPGHGHLRRGQADQARPAHLPGAARARSAARPAECLFIDDSLPISPSPRLWASRPSTFIIRRNWKPSSPAAGCYRRSLRHIHCTAETHVVIAHQWVKRMSVAGADVVPEAIPAAAAHGAIFPRQRPGRVCLR